MDIEHTKPSNQVYYSSVTLIGFIYFTAIFTLIEMSKFVKIVNLNDNFFKCRQPILNISYICSFLFVLYVLNPLSLFLCNVYGIQSTIPLLVNDIADILIFLTFFPRAWILWFDRMFSDNVKNWIWRREINLNDTGFLVKYRKVLKASHLLVYSVYLLLILPVFLTLHILPHFNIIPFYCHLMQAVLLVFLLCSTFCVTYKISVVTDEFHIRSELLRSVKSTAVMYIISHISYVTIYYYIDQHWALFVELLFVSVADLFVVYYACYWTRNKYVFRQKIRLIHQRKTNDGSKSSFLTFLTKPIQFQEIMCHKDGVEAFCHHLANEFGLESILFLLEVTQFKAVIRRLSNGQIRDNVPDLCNNSNVQISHKNSIFSAESILKINWLPIDPRMYSFTPYQIALYLYDKYIEESADLCINISFGIRKGIYNYFQQLSQQRDNVSIRDIQIKIDNKTGEIEVDQLNYTNAFVKMYKIYDEAFVEIWRLIQTDSFLRFKSTEVFRRLVTVLFPEDAKLANKKLIEMVDSNITKELQNKSQSRMPKLHTELQNVANLSCHIKGSNSRTRTSTLITISDTATDFSS